MPLSPHLKTIQNTNKRASNLELELKCDRFGQTIISHKYTAYPLSVSTLFRLDDDFDSRRAYLYVTSTSPGLFAGDELNVSFRLSANTSLYITDQAATKVHPASTEGSKATVDYDIEVGEGATLEFIPEPLILFADAALEQSTSIKIHPTGTLCLSDIILPGRLARGEFYQFHRYWSRLRITSTSGELWLMDAMRLEGKLNPFVDSPLFACSPILGSLLVVLPEANLERLSENVEDIEAAQVSDLTVASSILPYGKGLLIRAMASGTHEMKTFLKYALNCVRRSSHQPPIPDSI